MMLLMNQLVPVLLDDRQQLVEYSKSDNHQEVVEDNKLNNQQEAVEDELTTMVKMFLMVVEHLTTNVGIQLQGYK
jgi:uncharacterized FlaG/YvyC family protein